MKKVILIIMLLGAQVVTAQKGQSNHGSPPTDLSHYIKGSPYQITCVPKGIDNVDVIETKKFTSLGKQKGFISVQVHPGDLSSLVQVRASGKVQSEFYTDYIEIVPEQKIRSVVSDKREVSWGISVAPGGSGWLFDPAENVLVIFYSEFMFMMQDCKVGNIEQSLGDGLDI